MSFKPLLPESVLPGIGRPSAHTPKFQQRCNDRFVVHLFQRIKIGSAANDVARKFEKCERFVTAKA
jgi:hypothetical protein